MRNAIPLVLVAVAFALSAVAIMSGRSFRRKRQKNHDASSRRDQGH
jgi:hypothetical protein